MEDIAKLDMLVCGLTEGIELERTVRKCMIHVPDPRLLGQDFVELAS